MRTRNALAIAIAFGIIITWVSGFFRTPWWMEIDVVRKGAPFPWIMQVLPRPSTVIWSGMIEDAVFWAMVSGLIAVMSLRIIRKR